MSKREKRLARIRQNTRNVPFQDLQQVLLDHGFVLRFTTGSHYVFKAETDERSWSLSVPFRKPHLKEVYVKKALEAIDEIRSLTEEELENDNSDDAS